jgi:GT2 family glycosyltransferase
VVTYRSAGHVAEALGCLPDEVTVVVVDNDSPDESLAVARAARPDATVVANDANVGFGSACNQGAALGERPFVLFLNPDARLEPTALEAMAAHLRTNPDVGAVAPRLRRPDGEQQRPTWEYPRPGWHWERVLKLYEPPSAPPAEDRRLDGSFLVGACLMLRRAAFEQVGGFDERYWLFGEEADLQKRTSDAGWANVLLGTVEAEHVGGASATPDHPLVVEHLERASERYLLDWRGRGALLSMRFGSLAWNGVRWAARRPDPRYRVRTRRMARTLLTHPLTVADDRPG